MPAVLAPETPASEKQEIVDQILRIVRASNPEASIVLSFGLNKQGHLVGRYRAGTQVYDYELSLNSISDTPISESRSDSYLKGYYSGIEPAIAVKPTSYVRGWLERFDATKTKSSSTKKPKCTEGKSRICGGACIPLKNKDGSDRNCRFDPPPEIKKEIKEVTEKVKARQNKKSGAEAEKSTTLESASDRPSSKWSSEIAPSPSVNRHVVTIGEGKNKGEVEIANGSLLDEAMSRATDEVNSFVGLDAGEQISGLTPNINNVTLLTQSFKKKSGKFSKTEEVEATLDAIAQHSKEGDIIVVPYKVSMSNNEKKLYSGSLSLVGDSEGSSSAFVGKIRNGRITPLDNSDRQRMETGKKVRDLRRTQIDKVYDEFARGTKDLKSLYKEEDRIAAEVGKVEDEWIGRKPKKGVVKSVAQYKAKAEEWAKSQGLSDSANGFTAEATKAHDIGHPITHEMTGMSSEEIHQMFGGIKQKDGKPSLLAEEAIVNVVEHLSRGDDLEASVVNGLRVARVLSRNAQYETDAGRKTVRTKEFKDKLIELAEKVYKNDNFSEYMKLVREANRVSKTVTMSGDDLSDTASGG